MHQGHVLHQESQSEGANCRKDDKGKKGEEENAKVETTQAVQESRPSKEEEAEKQEIDHTKSKGNDKSRTVAEVLKSLGQCEEGFDWARDGNGVSV
jgi:hypothetical protein